MFNPESKYSSAQDVFDAIQEQLNQSDISVSDFKEIINSALYFAFESKESLAETVGCSLATIDKWLDTDNTICPEQDARFKRLEQIAKALPEKISLQDEIAFHLTSDFGLVSIEVMEDGFRASLPNVTAKRPCEPFIHDRLGHHHSLRAEPLTVPVMEAFGETAEGAVSKLADFVGRISHDDAALFTIGEGHEFQVNPEDYGYKPF